MRLRLPLVLSLMLLTACGAMAEQGDDSARGIQGYWVLQTTQQGSMRLNLDNRDSEFSLRVQSDNRARGQVACNSWQGQIRLGTGIMRLERVREGRSRCSFDDRRVAALADRYLSALSSTAHYQVDGDQLAVALSNGEIWTFQRR